MKGGASVAGADRMTVEELVRRAERSPPQAAEDEHGEDEREGRAGRRQGVRTRAPWRLCPDRPRGPRRTAGPSRSG